MESLNLLTVRSLALYLFETGQATLAQAASLADLSLDAFLKLLTERGIPAVDYSPEELSEELEIALGEGRIA
jgi:predicted HTH domain antitoxin